jgi:hypothetical protein
MGGAVAPRKEDKMRLWLAGLLALAMFTGFVTTTTAAPHRARAAKASRVAYVCTTCGVGADHVIACPKCRKPMGRVASYACMKCQISADMPAPCPECHQPMSNVASLYRHCSTCGFYYLKSKKTCPVCAKRHSRRKR